MSHESPAVANPWLGGEDGGHPVETTRFSHSFVRRTMLRSERDLSPRGLMPSHRAKDLCVFRLRTFFGIQQAICVAALGVCSYRGR
jgi:hypothetical protein